MTSQDPELAWLALDLLPQAVLIVADDGKVTARNAAAKGLFPAGECVWEVLQSADGPALDWRADAAALVGEPTGIVQRNVALVGVGDRTILADVCLRRLSSPAGGQGGAVLVVVDDVSSRAAMERQLAATQRLAGAEEVAARMAHELNNPLDGVMRYVGLAERLTAGEAARFLAGAREGLTRMAGTIRHMVAQGRRSGSSGQRAAAADLLEEAIRAFTPRAEALGVAVDCEFDDGVALADARVFQVFCNVIKNALDAMGDGGTLAIRMTGGQGRCEIEFADTGCGMTDQQAEQAFQPFYTTKPPGEGIGLGLPVCREILTQMGGTITVGPRGGGGTVVTVTLPTGQGRP